MATFWTSAGVTSASIATEALQQHRGGTAIDCRLHQRPYHPERKGQLNTRINVEPGRIGTWGSPACLHAGW